MITTSKWLGLLAVAFVAGSFVASPELRAYAANTIFSTDIVDGEVKTVDLANNAVTAPKVKDGEIKAAEIATDAVGAAEIQGVTKLIFAECSVSDSGSVQSGFYDNITCPVTGADTDDQAVVTANTNSICFLPDRAYSSTDSVQITMKNTCSSSQTPGTVRLSLIVFDK